MKMKLTLFVIVAGFALSTAAKASCHWVGPLNGGHFVCDSGETTAPASGPGVDYFTIHVKNDCRYNIHVLMYWKSMACQDYPGYTGGGSCLSGNVSEDQKWVFGGWWNLRPGEEKYVGDSQNAIVYFYGESLPSHRKVWGGDQSFDFNGTTYSFSSQNLGESFKNYTQHFKCR